MPLLVVSETALACVSFLVHNVQRDLRRNSDCLTSSEHGFYVIVRT